jgi:rhodanese-related sulfurtransferase
MLKLLRKALAPLLGALFVTSACAAPITTPTDAGAGLAKTISVADAAKLRESGAVVIDVRERGEWDEVHMPGATLIPLGTLANTLDRVPKDKAVVVICRSGSRSQTGRDILLKAGYTQVASVDGGMLAWERAGLPVQR